MHRRTLVGIAMIALVAMGIGIWRWMGKKDTFTPIQNPEPASVLVWNGAWGTYTNEKMKLSMRVPETWQFVEDASSSAYDVRTVIDKATDSGSIGKLEEITLTVQSKPQSGQELSTSAHFTSWLGKKQGDTEGNIRKEGDITMLGTKGVLLSENWKDNGQDRWSVLGWVRKNSVNYYVAAYGTGTASQLEREVLKTAASSLSPAK